MSFLGRTKLLKGMTCSIPGCGRKAEYTTYMKHGDRKRFLCPQCRYAYSWGNKNGISLRKYKILKNKVMEKGGQESQIG